ncbi:MAG: archaellin/type IV pilin N-terminal domain-containing protein, partial [Thermoplasmata archaeon]
MKIGKIYRKKKGVSPVIATILMVAITVVLAGVLYVMVMGLMHGPGS